MEVKKVLDKAIRTIDENYNVSVKEASNRDASRVIGIAQDIGFTTEDRGYIIILKNGDDKMFSQFKRRIAGIRGIKV